MFAIIETGGKQYKVSEGTEIDVEKLEGDADDEIEIDRVMAVYEDGDLEPGRPYVEDARAVGRIVEQKKGPKLTIFKYKPKTKYRRKMGHRQKLTRLKIESIER